MHEVTPIRIVHDWNGRKTLRIPHNLGQNMTVGDAFEEVGNVSEVLVGEDLFQRGLCSTLHICFVRVIWAFQKSHTILAHAFSFDQDWKLIGAY